jgi:hypothetical protein
LAHVGLKLPKQQDLWIRARGFYGTGCFNGSGAVLESVFYVFAPPAIHYAKPQATGTSDCLSWDNACNLKMHLLSLHLAIKFGWLKVYIIPVQIRTDWFNVNLRMLMCWGALLGRKRNRESTRLAG